MNNKSILVRLINGYYRLTIDDKKFKVYIPNINLLNKASEFYDKIIEEIKYDDTDSWLSENKRMFILNINNIWSTEKQKDLDQLVKDLDKMKIQLFLHYNNQDTKNLIKQKIAFIHEEINRLHYTKYMFYEHTKESYATLMKNRYLIKNSVYTNSGLFFKDKNLDYGQANYFLNKIMGLQKELSIKDIRSVVQTSDWRNLWDAAKSRIFGKPILKCNEEQKMAIGISQMFDNIRKHPKCPSEDVLSDSDALDGWIIHQNQENEKEKRKQSIEEKIKDKNAGEVFIMASSSNQIKEILDLNDPQTKAEMKQMHEYVKGQKKPTKWQDVPSIRQKIIRENNSK